MVVVVVPPGGLILGVRGRARLSGSEISVLSESDYLCLRFADAVRRTASHITLNPITPRHYRVLTVQHLGPQLQLQT